MKRLRKHFLTGLLSITPLAVTGWIAWRLYLLVDRALRPLLERYPPLQTLPDFLVTAMGAGLSVLLIVLVGLVSRNLIGVAFFNLVERLFNRIPIVKGIFTAVKQIAEVILSDSRKAFRQVVLFEYPRPGCWALGFVTREELEAGLLHVFLPTTPNPTSGFLLLLPREDVRLLDISVEEGIRLIISGGAVATDDQVRSLDRLCRAVDTRPGGSDHA